MLPLIIASAGLAAGVAGGIMKSKDPGGIKTELKEDPLVGLARNIAAPGAVNLMTSAAARPNDQLDINVAQATGDREALSTMNKLFQGGGSGGEGAGRSLGQTLTAINAGVQAHKATALTTAGILQKGVGEVMKGFTSKLGSELNIDKPGFEKFKGAAMGAAGNFMSSAAGTFNPQGTPKGDPYKSIGPTGNAVQFPDSKTAVPEWRGGNMPFGYTSEYVPPGFHYDENRGIVSNVGG